MNDFYAVNTYIKNTQGLLKSVTPFLSNIALNDPFNLKELQPMASLLNNPEAQERLKTMQMAHSKMQALKDSPIYNLNLRNISANIKHSYYQMQTILNVTAQDPLNGILSDVNTSKKVIPDILSNLDVSTINDCIQDIYANTPETSNTDFEENITDMLENFQAGVEEYNASTTSTKVKIPIGETITGKNLLYFFQLLAAITTILYYAGYNVKKDMIEPFITTIENTIDNITNQQ